LPWSTSERRARKVCTIPEELDGRAAVDEDFIILLFGEGVDLVEALNAVKKRTGGLALAYFLNLTLIAVREKTNPVSLYYVCNACGNEPVVRQFSDDREVESDTGDFSSGIILRLITSFLGMIFFARVLLPALAFFVSVAPAEARARKGMRAEWKAIERELRENGFKPEFVRFLRANFQTKRHDQVLRLNILGFLRPADHQALLTDESVEASNRFLIENQASLKKAKELFGVAPEIVAALLWVETRHGNVRGNFHVPSVYLSLVAGRAKSAQAKLLRHAKRGRIPASLGSEELRKKIESRCERKATWALEELRSIEKIFEKNPADAKALRGSFAGAFGFPQFIPSSYLKWAYTDRSSRAPNLYEFHDAILSVAHYLHQNGWGETSESQKKSLYSYNNSDDYVDAILNLSIRLKNSGPKS
jgi:membrane-bound lytic murein transglycosylase B